LAMAPIYSCKIDTEQKMERITGKEKYHFSALYFRLISCRICSFYGAFRSFCCYFHLFIIAWIL